MAKTLVQMETLFKALADATRLRILGLLLTGEICVCDIHESLKIPQSKASRHLAYLRRSGLVQTRRDGLWIHRRRRERRLLAASARRVGAPHLGPAPRRDGRTPRLRGRCACWPHCASLQAVEDPANQRDHGTDL